MHPEYRLFLARWCLSDIRLNHPERAADAPDSLAEAFAGDHCDSEDWDIFLEVARNRFLLGLPRDASRWTWAREPRYIEPGLVVALFAEFGTIPAGRESAIVNAKQVYMREDGAEWLVAGLNGESPDSFSPRTG